MGRETRSGRPQAASSRTWSRREPAGAPAGTTRLRIPRAPGRAERARYACGPLGNAIRDDAARRNRPIIALTGLVEDSLRGGYPGMNDGMRRRDLLRLAAGALGARTVRGRATTADRGPAPP